MMPTTATPAVLDLMLWRTRHGISQSEAARRLGVPFRTLQDWEYTGRCALPGLLQVTLNLLEKANAPCPTG